MRPSDNYLNDDRNRRMQGRPSRSYSGKDNSVHENQDRPYQNRGFFKNERPMERMEQRPFQDKKPFGGPPGIFKPGDWRCDMCQNINFSWRTACNKCKCPKKDLQLQQMPGIPSPRREMRFDNKDNYYSNRKTYYNNPKTYYNKSYPSRYKYQPGPPPPVGKYYQAKNFNAMNDYRDFKNFRGRDTKLSRYGKPSSREFHGKERSSHHYHKRKNSSHSSSKKSFSSSSYSKHKHHKSRSNESKSDNSRSNSDGSSSKKSNSDSNSESEEDVSRSRSGSGYSSPSNSDSSKKEDNSQGKKAAAKS
ncbi:MAG: zinc finger Ran-binding domain-containing protein [archaeon]|nr:zinc finger Ran-binding domain-containing protein [archaeon]